MPDALEVIDDDTDVSFDTASSHEQRRSGMELDRDAWVLMLREFKDIDVWFCGAHECP
jgi:hypothetical protein